MEDVYIRKTLAGDPDAFRWFIRKYQDLAFSVALSVVKEEHLAKDVCQDAFLACYQSLSKFKGNSRFSTWFYQIVVRTAWKAMKSIKMELTTFVIEEHDITNEDETYNNLHQEEKREMVQNALKLMPANESLALRLFYLDDQSMQDIQHITGWSIPNIKVILFRARKRMAIILNKLYLNS